MIRISVGVVITALIGGVLAAACSSKRKASPEPIALPSAPIAVDIGQEPIVNPLNMWEMMITGGPDLGTVGFIGSEKISAAAIDKAARKLLSTIGHRIYKARDQGWVALLEREGLKREARRQKKDLAELLVDSYALLGSPPATEIQALLSSPELQSVPEPERPSVARTLWRWRAWETLRSVLIDRGLRGVERKRYQLMLVSREFEPPTATVAVIGSRKVSRNEINLAAGYTAQSLRLEYFHAMEREFRTYVDRVLLERAAVAAGVKSAELLRRTYARLGKPPKSEVEAWMKKYPEYRPVPHRAADAVRTLREAAAKRALLDSLGAKSGGVRFALTKPKIDRIPPETIRPRTHGPTDARGVIAALHCIAGATCRKGNQILRGLIARRGAGMRIELGTYFSKATPEHIRYAVALRCADQHGKGWAFFERLVDTPTAPGVGALVAAAANDGVPNRAMRRCLARDQHIPLIFESRLRAERLGLVMNIIGVWVNGIRLEALQNAAQLDEQFRLAIPPG